MHRYTGQGVFQWEHSRQWVLNATSEYCRAEGALVLPGFTSLSIFFRRSSQTAGTFTLKLWTAPIYFRLLDDPIDANNIQALLYPLALEPAAGLTMTGTTAKVFGARIAPNQPMGSLLFWEMENTMASGTLIGDIYVVPNFAGSTAQPSITRAVEVAAGGGSGQGPSNSVMRAR